VRKFLIYSTPRSGSAWLSNFLTYNGSFCAHEPLAHGNGIYWAEYPVSGAIDTGAAYVGYKPPEGVDIFHLSRDRLEIEESLKRIGLPSYNLAAYKSQFRYRDLFDVDYLEVLWGVVTKLPFDRNRTEALIEMNVQRSISAIRSHLIRRTA
jgi:hypothetical protein